MLKQFGLFFQRSYNWFHYGGFQEWLYRVPGYPKRCFVCGHWYWLRDGHKYWDEAADSMCSDECQRQYFRTL